MRKTKLKSKEVIDEARDIVLNTEDDEAAIQFLRETLGDDYPDLDINDLHAASEILSQKEKSNNQNILGNLNDSLGVFLSNLEDKHTQNKKKNKAKKARRKKK